MAKALTDTQARAIRPGDKNLPDGSVTGLCLIPHATKKGNGSWRLRFASPETKTRRDASLGSYPAVSVAEARKRAFEWKEMIAQGIDPIETRKAEKAAIKEKRTIPTFQVAAEDTYESKKGGWKNGKHVDQWINTLRTYAFPLIGDRPVDTLEVNDFANVLKPIWTAKPETANRVKQRCKSVMDWCFARQYVTSNPVLLVDHLLPLANSKRAKEHQPALPWVMLPDFFANVLHDRTSGSCRELLEFTILAAARSGEVRLLTWDQINFDEKCWYVPREHMKEANHHRVPLTWRMIEILEARRELALHETLIFPSPRGKIYSENTTTKFLRENKVKSDVPGRYAVTHGFRSTFRTWGTEQGHREDYLEACLAHVERNAVVASYKRTDLFEARREIMNAFTDYACSKLNKPNIKSVYI